MFTVTLFGISNPDQTKVHKYASFGFILYFNIKDKTVFFRKFKQCKCEQKHNLEKY